MQIVFSQLRNPVLYLVVAALLMVKCELMFVENFGLLMHKHPSNYLGVLVLTAPLLIGLVQRRTVKRWVGSSIISSAAGLQVNRNMTALILLTYCVVYLVLALAWRTSHQIAVSEHSPLPGWWATRT